MAATATATATAKQANGTHPLTKNAKRRQKKKQQQQHTSDALASTSAPPTNDGQPTPSSSSSSSSSANAVGVRAAAALPQLRSLIDDSLDLDPSSEAYQAFSHVFSRFQQPSDSSHRDANGTYGDGGDGAPQKGEVIYSDDEVVSDSDASDADGHTAVKLSQRKLRKLQRLTVAELKQLVRKPEVVEWTDVTATDPRLLVQLKSRRNTVPVPPHWGQKRDYLQNKRGIEKAQYQLPSYIADTGIATIKDALKEKEAEQTLKQKTRERVQPKMGRMDIDYQKLHDAFFKFQSKPELSVYGETYYEGKENECKFKERKPGDLSDELKEALSIPPLAPPPWLIAMQRYGPPPSYPHLKVPGLNAPIPEGAQWGFHPGGWGRPPVDEYGRPLYGDVLRPAGDAVDGELKQYIDPVQREPWGELEPEETDDEEEESDDEVEEDEAEEAEGDATTAGGMRTPADGLDTPSGTASIATSYAGMETPSHFELRKESRGGTTSTSTDTPRALYQVLPERSTSITGLMGSERVYDMGPTLGDERGTKRKSTTTTANGHGLMEISIDPAELQGLSERQVQEKLKKLKAEEEQRTCRNLVPGVMGRGVAEGVAEVREELTRQRAQRQGRKDDEKKDKFRF